MGFPSYSRSCRSSTAIQTGVKENDCSLQGFRKVLGLTRADVGCLDLS